MQLTEKLGGNIELAIKQLAESKKQKNRIEMKYIFNEKQMRTLSVLLAGVMCLLAEACTEPQTDMSRLCGEWKSAIGKPDIRIAKDGKCYKLTLLPKGE